jgi:hypothetical protein
MAKAGMKAGKFRHRVTRTRVNGCKLPEFGRLQRRLWIRRVLVRAQEGRLEGPSYFGGVGPSVFFPPAGVSLEFLPRLGPTIEERRVTVRSVKTSRELERVGINPGRTPISVVESCHHSVGSSTTPFRVADLMDFGTEP